MSSSSSIRRWGCVSVLIVLAAIACLLYWYLSLWFHNPGGSVTDDPEPLPQHQPHERMNGNVPAVSSTSLATIQSGDGGEKSLNVSLLNYTDVNIGPVYVNGDWAGSMGKHLGAQGDGTGGAVIPAKWRPSYRLKISWSDDELYKKDPDQLYTRMVPMEPYGLHDGGILWVVFSPHGVIKLYASSYGPGNPHWPGRKMSPGSQCLLDGFNDCDSADKDWFEEHPISPYTNKPWQFSKSKETSPSRNEQ